VASWSGVSATDQQPIFFASPEEFRGWLQAHAGDAPELLVGFWKKGSGHTSMTWPESVDEALCVGWIDGVRRRVDDERYSIRFTPRRPTSIWSAVNVARVAALTDEGRMQPAGLEAYARRREVKTGLYSHEREHDAELEPEEQARLEANAAAWAFFSVQITSYRRAALHWVVGAKRPETRERRLKALIDDSAAGVFVKHLRR
jgi:uncharacterized protein YdeI (YjbR/CyaY-like superfamily)